MFYPKMHSVISFLDQQLPPYEWYAGDLEATVKESTCSDFASQQIKKVGSQAKLVEICSRVDQFLSGVFLAGKLTILCLKPLFFVKFNFA